MLSCKEVTRTIASEELAEAGWWRRVQVQLHLRMCQHCRGYAAQLRVIGNAARDLWGPRLGDEGPETVKRLEAAILKGRDRGLETK